MVIDAFTKFLWTYATKTTNATEVIVKLKKQSMIFGNPRRIISDRDTAFTSKEFEDYCAAEKIKHVLTTIGIPRANGQVERVNRVLIPLLTKLSESKREEWFKFLDLAKLRLNCAPHRFGSYWKKNGSITFRIIEPTCVVKQKSVTRRSRFDPMTLMMSAKIKAFKGKCPDRMAECGVCVCMCV